MICEQKKCEAPAAFSFQWPGDHCRAACAEHAGMAVSVAAHLGFQLHVFPVEIREAELAGAVIRSLTEP